MTQEQALKKLTESGAPGEFMIDGLYIVWRPSPVIPDMAWDENNKARAAVAANLSKNVTFFPREAMSGSTTFCIFLKQDLW